MVRFRGERRIVRTLIFSLIFAGLLAVRAEEALPQVKIGIVRDGEWALLDTLLEGLREELAVLVEGEFDVVYPPELDRDGRWELSRIQGEFRDLLEDEQVDLVLALGLAASQIACLGEGYDKPVMAPLSLDFQIQNLPRDGPGSGVRNLTYLGLPSTLREELETFRELAPFRHVALLTNAEVLAAMPEIVPRTLQRLEGTKLEVSYVAAGRTASSILGNISDAAEAVYVWPLLLEPGELDLLIEGLNERGLPSFSAMGRHEVAQGMFATLSGDGVQRRLSRRVALDIQQILLGVPPETISVDYSARSRLVVNVETSRRIGASPRFELLLEAELIGSREGDDADPLTISEAVARAVEANLSLRSERASLETGLEEIALARAELFPASDASLSGVGIDEDRALAGFGPERTLTGRVGLSQLLYSDRALGGVEIARSEQRAREHDLERRKLDVALDTAVAFLDLLRARNLFEIRRSNLELTRSNLELARTRRRIGTGSSAEVFRWDSQIAEDRRNLVDANASRESARILLNRLLHEPLEKPWQAVELTVGDPTFSIGRGVLDGYIETPRHFTAFREFVVLEGLESSPELASLDAVIAARRRSETSARRSFWAPTLALEAGIDEQLDSAGAGSGPAPVGAPDDTSWSVSINATLPLSRGGARRAELRSNRTALRALELERQGLAETIEQSIRTAMISARASYTGIGLAQASAEAARKNFELVQDAYARGALSIIDLIDAQDSALSAELGATDAVYDFFGDLMRVQRAANGFDFFIRPEERAEWLRRLREHFDERGIRPWGSAP